MIIFSELPFEIKGHILSFIGNYVFRKGRTNDIFVCRISRERIEKTRELFATIPVIMTWKTGEIWRSCIEFSIVSPIWRMIRQNYEYTKGKLIITSEIQYYCEKRYYNIHHVFSNIYFI
jgi:hypothetical protein